MENPLLAEDQKEGTRPESHAKKIGHHKRKEAILVIGAHNDDHILGAGGTIAKYAKEGKDIVIIIFSYGEASHVWLKRKEAVKMRVRESMRADRLFGVKKTYYLGLTEGRFEEEFREKALEKRLNALINIIRPIKIFTHSIDDLHPDHRAVFRIVSRTLDRVKYSCEMYSFDIWNPLNIKKRSSPKLVVDVSDTFNLKIRAFKIHKSQWMAKVVMLPLTYIRALTNGIMRDTKYAEVFYKLR